MTNEHNFKVGNKVRFTGDYAHYVERTLEKGEEYTVTDVDSGGNCDLSVSCTAYSVNAEDLELVEPCDRKTDFLQRLQSLLREFDASIGYFIGDDEEYGWCDYPFLKIGNEIIKYPAGEIDQITADNIMDFDKD